MFLSDKFLKIAKNNFILYEADNRYNKYLVAPSKLKTNHKQKVIAFKKGMILTDYYYPFFESVIYKYKQ